MTTEEIAIKLTDHENRLKVSEHRIKDLEQTSKDIMELTISVKELAMSVKSMVSEQKKHGERISALEHQPTESWNTIKKTALTSIVSAISGALVVGLIAIISNYI